MFAGRINIVCLKKNHKPNHKHQHSWWHRYVSTDNERVIISTCKIKKMYRPYRRVPAVLKRTGTPQVFIFELQRPQYPGAINYAVVS